MVGFRVFANTLHGVAVNLFFALMTLKATIAFAAPTLPFNADDVKTMSPAMQKSLRDNYCKDVEKSKQFINLLSDVSEHNNRLLKVGSFVAYSVVETTERVGSEKPEVLKHEEIWTLSAREGNEYIIEVTRSRFEREFVRWNPDRKIYNGSLSEDNPMGCLEWAVFAEEFGKQKLLQEGRTWDALYRQQAKLANIVPRFVYAKDIPFHILQSSEVIELEKEKKIIEKFAVRFSF